MGGLAALAASPTARAAAAELGRSVTKGAGKAVKAAGEKKRQFSEYIKDLKTVWRMAAGGKEIRKEELESEFKAEAEDAVKKAGADADAAAKTRAATEAVEKAVKEVLDAGEAEKQITKEEKTGFLRSLAEKLKNAASRFGSAVVWVSGKAAAVAQAAAEVVVEALKYVANKVKGSKKEEPQVTTTIEGPQERPTRTPPAQGGPASSAS